MRVPVTRTRRERRPRPKLPMASFSLTPTSIAQPAPLRHDGWSVTQIFTALAFAAHLKAIERDLDAVVPAVVARACQMIADEAKRVLGKGYDDWPALKPETLARKLGPGPLLETGELRDSISWRSEGLHGQVG